MKRVWYDDYPIGVIGIAEDSGSISHLFFGRDKGPAGFEVGATPLIEKAVLQLREYFDGKRTEFDLPLCLQGTEFQQSVWKALQTIAAAETRSYKEIAVQIGNPKAVRAVGMANNRNPISIIVPCHRVVGADGSLTGYGGGLPVKKYLLDLEKRYYA
ncbi:methylated-DNA/protein-cysteinemethyltransferase [Syntrophobotulus glycolicus DSM 8271]|uniref:Methylated-DNA--protein-cysteine methyltransferase n=1 Tax=Syntrophobotulus glycolicus (strain DSM 8271 / FlGlyR) TaxID=645991 RepID=F0SX43_SYNGF|nr:methylated-DNA--[protein]-cysteine S-methyltransferase [Syntrophobotulus glycolicus]ADY55826.1 methylated-DNA/protein-cysteinemethyltransferase [Syntrophobotulus glycolicus DSM 8271]